MSTAHVYMILEAVLATFVYLVGFGRVYRWALQNWGTPWDSAATFFLVPLWPLWYPLKGVILWAFNLGFKERSKLPKAEVRR